MDKNYKFVSIWIVTNEIYCLWGGASSFQQILELDWNIIGRISFIIPSALRRHFQSLLMAFLTSMLRATVMLTRNLNRFLLLLLFAPFLFLFYDYNCVYSVGKWYLFSSPFSKKKKKKKKFLIIFFGFLFFCRLGETKS